MPEITLAGSITYTPYTHFNRDVMEKLRLIIEEVRSPDGSENPEVLLDWVHITRNDKNIITRRSNIILYRNGGDWAEEDEGHYEDIGVLFCRQDQQEQQEKLIYRVNIPDDQEQDRLLLACEDLFINLKTGETEQLETIKKYLYSIIDDESKWIDLNKVMQELF